MSERFREDNPAPVSELAVYRLPHEVISCAQAALAKGFALENELKTLIISDGEKYFALHLRGDRRASLRKVKTFLHSEQAFMLSPEALEAIGLAPGTVSPVIEPVWSFSHLVSKSVLDLAFVSTNNGTRSMYVKFDPHILLRADHVEVGDFEQ